MQRILLILIPIIIFFALLINFLISPNTGIFGPIRPIPPLMTISHERPFEIDFVTLNANPTAYQGQYLRLTGTYTPIPFTPCLTTHRGPQPRWGLVADSLLISSTGYEDVTRRLPEGLPMIIDGYWLFYHGPLGCGKQPPNGQSWYFSVRHIVAPNPLSISYNPQTPWPTLPPMTPLNPLVTLTPNPTLILTTTTTPTTPTNTPTLIATPRLTPSPSNTPRPNTTPTHTPIPTLATLTPSRTTTPPSNSTTTRTPTPTRTRTPTPTPTRTPAPTATRTPAPTPIGLPTATLGPALPTFTPTSNAPYPSTPSPTPSPSPYPNPLPLLEPR